MPRSRTTESGRSVCGWPTACRASDGTVYPSAMRPFAASLNDTDIVDIANHERSAWDNKARPVTAEQVKAARAAGK
jgi:nitrite reductase (NO-forming)